MKFLQRFLIISACIIILSVVYALFSTVFFRSFLDFAFLSSLFCVTAGAFLFVLEGGFFNSINHSFKLFRKSTKEGQYIAEFDDLDDTNSPHEEYPKKKRHQWTYPLLSGGGWIALATFVLALIS
ncbi:hypothetical protein AC623_03780 [Bacillus sp. FJAT-27231]|uniref:DUF3899 domain-containing protein n=1 Tax=Bacillus sp. FJAT-27231 TaxID=1679168 RepID=UPI000671752E|nr:DUF3899 domain-containing protein [Bacillus sp. FJAT-27231]KMY53213.1 hypothetical protein AC623_03780 [Bacillus sp. FJAT-27231]